MKPNPMPAVVAEPETGQRAGAEKSGLYRVILLDDDDHSYNYVIEMLQRIFYFSVQQALRHAREVDLVGRTVLITCGRREAEFSRDQIQAWGPDPLIPRCGGSMSALIEPATAE
jgi:ATP-dependent Clp protease adaptor protein ClpS